MMATPQDLEDFAIGFSLNEGLVERVADIEISSEAEIDGNAAGFLFRQSVRVDSRQGFDQTERNAPVAARRPNRSRRAELSAVISKALTEGRSLSVLIRLPVLGSW